jgi:hypothetical protein
VVRVQAALILFQDTSKVSVTILRNLRCSNEREILDLEVVHIKSGSYYREHVHAFIRASTIALRDRSWSVGGDGAEIIVQS